MGPCQLFIYSAFRVILNGLWNIEILFFQGFTSDPCHAFLGNNTAHPKESSFNGTIGVFVFRKAKDRPNGKRRVKGLFRHFEVEAVDEAGGVLL
jgi:hypothetical protein